MREITREVLELVVRPTLKGLGLHSDAAESLLLGTCLAETGLRELEQGRGGKQGPALGFWQMEPATHDDLWKNFLEYRPDLQQKLLQVAIENKDHLLVWNLRYAAAMARLKYLIAPGPIPDTVEGQADYWKRHYNTPAGAGTVKHYLEAWGQR